ncbi:DGQHR domain-containing protein [Micromonospora sp. WMMD1082]|uniref:DGQHR domain-containing protein n=1 Tax=Micromonospora sp. WMMD1082 TaxID=3016104 RepID=UPI002415F16B|nr:DGQHR domain-containing protein [Micromonospora sp. WMMD1082]MDG4793705.1 DGQHR domain-containing protein [Micromonospora sp. WMMD1082]
MNVGEEFCIDLDQRGEARFSILAADDETVLVVQCVSAREVRSSQLRAEIHALRDVRVETLRALRRIFPGRKAKIILATKNIALMPNAQSSLEDADIIHMDEEAISYFLSLAEHLGKAARFQLLGNLFAGQRIQGLDSEVHALRGKMGGITYYFFAIEPDRLLKIAYVLHRNRANSDLMPTYQRLIRRSRLQDVSRFVDAGGFFPNSIILNMETGRSPRFDPATKAGDGPVMGVLHLPQTYRSAFVIDGQHRLYGYANSDRAVSELIPVVAFVNLPRSEQIRLFMQINENQQAVPKNLRNTLNADLLWDSDDLRQRSRALKLRVAQHLGESKSSPLYGRVIIGENTRSPIRCLTIEAISNGLTRGSFVGSFNKSSVKDSGTFYMGTNDATFALLVPFLERCFRHLRDKLFAQWTLGGAEGGFVFINPGIESLLKIFSDIVDHLILQGAIDPRITPAEDVYRQSSAYLDAIVEYVESLGVEQAAEYRRMYGSGGTTRYWRRLQRAIQKRHPDFDPPGLSAFLEDEAKTFNTESFKMIREIETFLNEDIKRKLQEKFGKINWFALGVPRKVRESSMTMAAQKNVDLPPDKQVGPWDCLHIIDYCTIMTQSQDLWLELFAKRYTLPGEGRPKASWRSRSSWMNELNRIRNQNFHTYTVKPSEYEFLVEVTGWLLREEGEDDI